MLMLCKRHPDHIGAKDTVEYWSHHEKVRAFLIIVLYIHHSSGCHHRQSLRVGACVFIEGLQLFKCAQVGGLDLCFGRWDTHSQYLSIVHSWISLTIIQPFGRCPCH